MLLQHTALFGYGIAYTITASISFGYVPSTGRSNTSSRAGVGELVLVFF
jgi:hypothetical protein